MPHEILGQSQNGNGRYAIVVSTYNSNITNKLLAGAIETLASSGVADGDIVVVRPGEKIPVDGVLTQGYCKSCRSKKTPCAL